MSNLPSPPTPPNGPGDMMTRRRRGGASVTLRQDAVGSGRSMGDMMDPASKSLADALKITYRLLQIGMVIILAIYFLSGFQSIKETQRGVRLQFGKVESSNLAPGFRFAYPEPIGEIVRVETGDQTAELKNEFFPSLSDTEEKSLEGEKGIQALAGGGGALDADRDGQLLTGDRNIVHARWTVSYRRTDPYKTVENIAQDSEGAASNSVEKNIVIASVRRGIVQAASVSTIDEVLKKQSDSGAATRSIERLAKQIAQSELDKLESGIQIQELLMKSPMPPRSLIQDFNQVQASQSQANTMLQDAEGYRKTTLSTEAGEAADTILAQIDQYERALALNQTEQADQILTNIQSLMQHKAVTIDGKQISPNIYGTVSNMLADAQEYRTNVVSQSQADASMFHAKRKAYLSNPTVMLSSEWSDAFRSFISSKSVQVMQVWDGLALLEIQINRDPDVLRDIKNEALKRYSEETRLKQIRERNRAQYESDLTGTGRSEQ